METQRSLAALLALLPDNVNGDISPEDVRDIVETFRTNHGGVYNTSNSLVDIVTAGVWVDVSQNIVITPPDVHGFVISGGGLQYVGPSERHAIIVANASFTVAGSNQYVSFRIVKNGSPLPGVEADNKIGIGSDVQAISINATTHLNNGDIIKVQVANDTSNADITLTHYSLSIVAHPS